MLEFFPLELRMQGSVIWRLPIKDNFVGEYMLGEGYVCVCVADFST